MSSGPKHYRLAEAMLERALQDYEAGGPCQHAVLMEAQIHAQLATAAAVMESTLRETNLRDLVEESRALEAWKDVTS